MQAQKKRGKIVLESLKVYSGEQPVTYPLSLKVLEAEICVTANYCHAD